MTQVITVGKRGTVTLPVKLRERYDIKEEDRLIVEETPEGLLLRPSVSVPVELYTEARIAEFAADDAVIGEILDRKAGR